MPRKTNSLTLAVVLLAILLLGCPKGEICFEIKKVKVCTEFSTAEEAETVVAAAQKADVDINTKYRNGKTLLHLAAERAPDPAVIHVLLEAGADPSAQDNLRKTPLDYAERNKALKASVNYRQLQQQLR